MSVFDSTNKLFRVYHPDYMGDGEFQHVHAWDHEEAAERYCERYDSDCAEGPTEYGNRITVTVQQESKADGSLVGDAKKFVVWGEQTVSYISAGLG